MMASLNGRTVLITGAARGIGAATARRLATDGARLVLADQDGAGVEKLAAELKQVAVKADVTKPDDIARMVEEPYKRWGRLDVLFNNAGVIRVQPMLEVTETEWDRVMSVNLRAAWNRRIKPIPLGRPETPDDVAGVIAFLAGPDSDYMTGQAIKVDGGLVMGD